MAWLAVESSTAFGRMSANPSVTVLMSVYNGEQFLREAIDSILKQSYRDFEFIIYDDCSTDTTQSIVMSYADSRIRYRRNDINRGLTENLADGVNRSNAKYIVRMDADDIAFPDRIERQVAWMESHTDISIMGTPVSYFYEKPGDRGVAGQPYKDETIKAKLFIDFTLMHPSIIIRRESLVRHGINYNPAYRYSQDHALYFDCILAGLKFANMTAPLLYMRAHEGSISRYRHSAQRECSCRARTQFLINSGIEEGLTKEEIEVYNSFASGEFPRTRHEVRIFEQFAIDVCNNPATGKYFNVTVLLNNMAGKLVEAAYFASGRQGLKKAAWAGFNTRLSPCNDRSGIKHRLKFLLKLLLQK